MAKVFIEKMTPLFLPVCFMVKTALLRYKDTIY